MALKGKVIDLSSNIPTDKFVEDFEFNNACPKYGSMLKIDKTYTDAKVRWNPCDNRIYGICYEQEHATDMTFTSYEHVSDIAAEVDEGEKHVVKENMVIAVSSNSKNSKVEHQGKIIKAVSSKFKERNGAPFLNWSTAGDPARRQLFSSLMLHEISDPMLKSIISDLKFFNMNVGGNNETTTSTPSILPKE